MVRVLWTRISVERRRQRLSMHTGLYERVVRHGQWERRCNCRPSATGQRHIGDLQSSLPARQRRQQRPQPNDDDDDDAILHSVCVAPPPPAVHHAPICLTSDLRRTDVTAHFPLHLPHGRLHPPTLFITEKRQPILDYQA